MTRFAILISGRGSNMEAILDHWDKHRDAGAPHQTHLSEPVLVISNREDALGLQRAKERGIAAELVDHKAFPDRPGFEKALIEVLESHQVEFIVLAGFMRVFSPLFVARYRQRILNTHPSLLPDFPGKDAVQQAIDSGAVESGCTIHWVDEGVDSGRIVAQARVPVHAADDVSLLAERIRREEHLLYPRVIAELAPSEHSNDMGAPEGDGGMR